MKKLFRLVMLLVVACLSTTACSADGCLEGPYCLNTNNVGGYIASPNTVTPKGIAVDPSGQVIDLEAIDRMVDELEACVKKLSESFDRTAYSNKHNFVVMEKWPTEIDRSRLVVMIPKDWVVNESGNQVMLKHDMNKGGDVQLSGYPYLDTAYVTPNLAALKHEVIHVAYWVYDEGHPLMACQ